MRHQLPLYPVQLAPTQVKPLLQLIQAHRTPQAIVRRARIVLSVHAHPDWSSQQIAQLLELNARLVRKWRRRWHQTHSRKRFAQIRSTSSFLLSGSRTSDSAGLQPASISWSPDFLVGVKQHWHALWRLLLACLLSQPAALGAFL